MGYRDAVARATTQSYELALLLVSDLSDADLLVRPVPHANHIAWQLGHVILQESRSIGSQNLAVEYPELPAGFDAQHSDATAKVEPPCGFLTKREYLGIYTHVHAATMATLASLSDADLDRPVVGEESARNPTLGDLFLSICNNTGVHQGQFTVVRRKLGKSVLY